jgi:hypothetical protein
MRVHHKQGIRTDSLQAVIHHLESPISGRVDDLRSLWMHTGRAAVVSLLDLTISRLRR